MVDIFNKCFEKHSFQELNSGDLQLLTRALNTCVLDSSSVVFDVGTNAGSFVRALRDVNPNVSNVHCFEPHPVLAGTTKTVYPFITMNEVCLGNINGRVDIYIPKWSVGISSIVKRPVFDRLNQEIVTHNVECRTVDAYCSDHGIQEIAFMKIDVEGGEKVVLDGAYRMLHEKRIRAGIFEIGETLTDAGTSAEEICTLLESHGYKIDKTFDAANYIFRP
jgi:FkbM family methyltransferase